MKLLTESLKQSYILEAHQKYTKDVQQAIQYAKNNNLNIIFENCSPQLEAEHIYYIAKKMWETDGFSEPISNFKNIKQTEQKFVQTHFADPSKMVTEQP